MARILTDYSEERDALLYVMSKDCNPKGWRVELLVENLSSKVEEKLLLCSCCNGLLRDACICKGALTCQVCIPEDIAPQPVEMNRAIVGEKMIYCPLKWRGCGWSNRVSTVVHHLGDCLYLAVACPLGCVSLEGERKGELVKIERRLIQEHVRDSCPLRKVVCEFCEGEVKASEMNPHLDDCEGFPLPCPNGCSREGEEGMRELKRKDIPVHLDNHCPLQKIQCAYWDHGCREEMERRHTDTHEREFLLTHFNLSTELLQNELDIANRKIRMLERRHLNFLNELTEVKEESKILGRQITDKDERIQSLSEIVFSYTQLPVGRLEWSVSGVKQKIRNGESISSDPFYVGFYRCQGWIIWEYTNTGNVLVLIRIMKGDYDDRLHWPFRYKCSVILINQINSENNLVKCDEVPKIGLKEHPCSFERPPESGNIEGFGIPLHISNTEILAKKYCKQDSVTFHISIELLPPL